MAKTLQEAIVSLEAKTPGYEVFYVEDTGNNTYDTEITKTAHFFEIANTGASSLTIEVNGDGTVYTVLAGKGFGYLGKRTPITSVEVTATDTYTLLIRE